MGALHLHPHLLLRQPLRQRPLVQRCCSDLCFLFISEFVLIIFTGGLKFSCFAVVVVIVQI